MKKTFLAFIIGLSGLASIYLITRSNNVSFNDKRVVTVRSNGQTIKLTADDINKAPTPRKRYKIGVLFPFIASPFWVNEAYGVLDQAKRVGVDVVWLSADGYANTDKQNNQIDDLVTQGVDAILLAATSNVGTIPAVNSAVKRGVPVFAHVTSSSTPSISAAVINDDLEIGRSQAEEMGKALQGKGNVAMLNGPPAADWATRRAEGFTEVIKSKYPLISVVTSKNGIPDRADAQKLSEDILTAFPNLRGIFTVADGMAMGAADAVTNAKLPGKVAITTASFSRESVPFILSGRITANVDENPVMMGRASINMVVNALNGIAVPKISLIPSPIITRDNIKSIKPSEQWAPEGWRLK